MEAIVKTEVQGIEAETLLKHFKDLNNRINQLQETVKPQPAIQLLTRQEVAKWLGVSLPTLHSWTKLNILQAYRIGNKVRYKKNEVLEALQTMNQKQ